MVVVFGQSGKRHHTPPSRRPEVASVPRGKSNPEAGSPPPKIVHGYIPAPLRFTLPMQTPAVRDRDTLRRTETQPTPKVRPRNSSPNRVGRQARRVRTRIAKPEFGCAAAMGDVHGPLRTAGMVRKLVAGWQSTKYVGTLLQLACWIPGGRAVDAITPGTTSVLAECSPRYWMANTVHVSGELYTCIRASGDRTARIRVSS